MAAPKFLKLIAGVLTEVFAIETSAGAGDADKIVATNASGQVDATFMPGGAPISASAGAGSAGVLPKLDSSGRLSSTMMPSGIIADTQSVVTSEDIAAGDPVNLWNNAGTLNARKADATAAGKECDGFVLAATTSGQSALVYLNDVTVTGLSALTPGSTYFLSTTAGAITATPPSTSGNVVQSLGKATSATTLSYKRGAPVTLA